MIVFRTTLLAFLAVVFSPVLLAQQGVSISESGNPPAGSAILDVQSSSKGFLPPRMTTTERNNIASPVSGLVIYNTDNDCLNYYDGAVWTDLCGGGGCEAPAQPSSITGGASQLPASTGLVYRVNAVPGATQYNWTVPAGWTVTRGQGTVEITVTAGSLGNNGNITVSAQNECGTSASAALAVTSSCPVVGNLYGGGVVAYRAPAGCSGVIAGQYDGLPNYNWQNATDYCAWQPPVNGFGGWSLPDQTQLGYLYTNRVAIGSFTGLAYWTSVTAGSSNAWTQNFTNGTQNQLNRTSTTDVRFRCIRTFSL